MIVFIFLAGCIPIVAGGLYLDVRSHADRPMGTWTKEYALMCLLIAVWFVLCAGWLA